MAIDQHVEVEGDRRQALQGAEVNLREWLATHVTATEDGIVLRVCGCVRCRHSRQTVDRLRTALGYPTLYGPDD